MEKIAINDLKCSNSKKIIDDFKKSKFIKFVKKYGQLRPIIINSKKEVIDGKILFDVLKSLDYKEVWVIAIDTDNENQFYTEFDLLIFERKPIDIIDSFYNSSIDDNCFPYDRRSLEKWRKLKETDWSNYKKKIKKKVLF